MTSYPPPNPPVIDGSPAKHSGLDNKPINRVVIHSAVMPCEPGRAKQLGHMNSVGSGGGSWHYAVDPTATYQCSYDRYVCWHAPPNSHSIGIEMADNPSRLPGRWLRKNQKLMLERTAKLTAELCLAYGIPIRFLSVEDVKAGRRGITTHNNVSKAFHQSSHWDPGSWPRATFMKRVHAHADAIKKKG
jgi:hypothetical protein